MKARVKATGEIVDIAEYSAICVENYDTCFYPNELEILDNSEDYWTRLEHQYAGMAMQGILSNSHIAFKDIKVDTVTDVYVDNIIKIARALVERYKKEERK